ncbi:MAG: hypothetical protein KDD36_00440 [Flavobacteriales bacterium]|nr:hypothetical protein [Flavobacteriales bacterium]
MNKITLFSLMALTMASFSCQTGNDHQDQEGSADSLTVNETAEAEAPSTFEVMLPSPLQIARIFQKAGLPFKKGLVNDPSKVSSYASTDVQTLNFGVYSADLSYLVLNKQSQDAFNQLKAVKELASSIGLSPIFNDAQMIASFEKNIGVEDSMITTLVNLQEKLHEVLEDGEQEHLNTVIFAGAWIEGMYLGSQSTGQDIMPGINSRILEQMAILGNLIKGLENQPNHSEMVAAIITGLKDIQTMYNGFASVKALDQSQDVELDQLQLTNEEKTALTEKIAQIRSSIIQG